jgi:hypothetical protein
VLRKTFITPVSTDASRSCIWGVWRQGKRQDVKHSVDTCHIKPQDGWKCTQKGAVQCLESRAREVIR